MIHEIKDLNRIAVKRVKHTELILSVSGGYLMCLQHTAPVSVWVNACVCVCVWQYRICCILLISALIIVFLCCSSNPSLSLSLTLSHSLTHVHTHTRARALWLVQPWNLSCFQWIQDACHGVEKKDRSGQRKRKERGGEEERGAEGGGGTTGWVFCGNLENLTET